MILLRRQTAGRVAVRLREEADVKNRILVVDDEKNIVFAMKTYFMRHGFDVDCATDSAAALALLDENAYTLAILDLQLGGTGKTEGLAIAQRLRDQSAKIPIILLTAHGTPEIEASAKEIGINTFLKKPKPLAELAQIAFLLLEH